MKNPHVAELSPGTRLQTTFLVQSKERKTASTGKPYLDLELRDASGVIRAKVWDCDRLEADFDVEDFVLAQGHVEAYKGTPQIVVNAIRRLADEEIDPRDYFPRSSRDPEEMYAQLVSRVERMPEGPLRSLLLAVVQDPEIAPKLKLAPAAVSFHHAYLGGLLEHILSLIQLGDQVSDHYGSLRRDLILVGLVLHDLGKIEELNYLRSFRYSTRGQLVGHIALTLGIVREKLRAIPDFPDALRDQIEHIILSHHGKAEFGSPREPMFPEALVVHYLDDLDSKLESMRAQYAADKDRPGDWTARNPALKRELLKATAD